MSISSKSVLVTGGAGFIGSHVVDRLAELKVKNLVVIDDFSLGKDRNLAYAKKAYPKLKVYEQDLADEKATRKVLEAEGIEVVFNLAVIPLPASLVKPEHTFMENVAMTMAICEAQREKLFDTLIHFSSSEVYGTAIQPLMTEEHVLGALTPYAASKAACDHLVFSYRSTFGADSAIIRPFNNYGPRQNEGTYAGVIPLTIKRIMHGEPPIIYGDGKQTRDYIFVRDTAQAAIDVYESEKTRGRVLNIASGKEVSINHLVKVICQEMGFKGEVRHEPERPGDVRRHVADISLSKKLIGFEPKTPLEDGMKETIEWYKRNIQLEAR
jgi:UDP-glucose 4-epimerase